MIHHCQNVTNINSAIIYFAQPENFTSSPRFPKTDFYFPVLDPDLTPMRVNLSHEGL